MTETERLSLKTKASEVKLWMWRELDSEGSWAAEYWLSPVNAPSGSPKWTYSDCKQILHMIMIEEICFQIYLSTNYSNNVM